VGWTDVAHETHYEVLRETLNTKNGRWSGTNLVAPADSTSLIESLGSGTYRYSLRAVGSAGNSAWVVAGCDSCAADGSFSVTTATSGSTKPKGKR
jgi:hypothetical protein